MWESSAVVIWWFSGAKRIPGKKSRDDTNLKKTLHFLYERSSQIERVVHLEFSDQMYPNVIYRRRVQSAHFSHMSSKT